MGREFDNTQFHQFAIANGLVFRFSCPQTSPQNGKAERMIRRLNEITLALLYHASLPTYFWVEALHIAVYLHNILHTKILKNRSPASALYLKNPSFTHLRVFGCACYPNLSSQRPHKLASRSTRCVFLGYPPQHRGYRCLDLATNKIIISRHVTFDESEFPFPSLLTHSSAAYSSFNPISPIILDNVHPSPTNTPPTPRTPNSPPRSPAQPSPTPHHTPTPTPPPPPPPPIRTMTTRRMNGIFKPRALTTSPISPLPKSPHLALRDPNWNVAMQDEYCAFLDKHTWD